MKNFKRIVLLSTFFMVGIVCGMAKKSATRDKWFVKLDSRAQKIIKYSLGSDVSYYGRHRAQQQDDGSLLFPVEFTDSLPIEYYHNKRYFITRDTKRNPEQACQILGSSIKQLVVVQGIIKKDELSDFIENRHVNIYLDLDTDKVQVSGDKGRIRIYPARVMLLQQRD